jgi:citrate synthase
MRAKKAPIPGFGHPQHADGDPRANVLLKLADERGLNGPYIKMLRTVESALPEALGRALPININGAIPAILLEIGFPLSALKSISILARTAGLLAHLREEAHRIHPQPRGGRGHPLRRRKGAGLNSCASTDTLICEFSFDNRKRCSAAPTGS